MLPSGIWLEFANDVKGLFADLQTKISLQLNHETRMGVSATSNPIVILSLVCSLSVEENSNGEVVIEFTFSILGGQLVFSGSLSRERGASLAELSEERIEIEDVQRVNRRWLDSMRERMASFLLQQQSSILYEMQQLVNQA